MLPELLRGFSRGAASACPGEMPDWAPWPMPPSPVCGSAINFWISYCLVPREMRMYPGRLPASAWHLANTPAGQVIGFSGG